MIEITCMLCGAHGGWMEVEQHFVDTRCTSCEHLHGSFKEMVEEYANKTNQDGMAAENFVKQHNKRMLFDPALDVVVTKLKEEREKKAKTNVIIH